MMPNEYLNRIVRRANELALLEQSASFCAPKRTGAAAVRWAIGAAFGLLVTLLPSVCSAHAFFQMF